MSQMTNCGYKGAHLTCLRPIKEACVAGVEGQKGRRVRDKVGEVTGQRGQLMQDLEKHCKNSAFYSEK